MTLSRLRAFAIALSKIWRTDIRMTMAIGININGTRLKQWVGRESLRHRYEVGIYRYLPVFKDEMILDISLGCG